MNEYHISPNTFVKELTCRNGGCEGRTTESHRFKTSCGSWATNFRMLRANSFLRIRSNCDCHVYYTNLTNIRWYWSCSFLPSAKSAFILLPMDCIMCEFCGFKSYGNNPKGWTECIHHLATEHNYRSCDQPTFTCDTHFIEHLIKDHSLSFTHNASRLLPIYQRYIRLSDAAIESSSTRNKTLQRIASPDGSKKFLNSQCGVSQ